MSELTEKILKEIGEEELISFTAFERSDDPLDTEPQILSKDDMLKQELILRKTGNDEYARRVTKENL